MNDRLSKNLISPLLIGLAVWVASICPTVANPTSPNTSSSSRLTNTLAAVSDQATAEQIEQATQATEIRPGDWAYQTLQALSTKYSCGNAPTGNKILSREEFATSLNGCVQSIEQLVARRRPRKALKKRRYTYQLPAVETATTSSSRSCFATTRTQLRSLRQWLRPNHKSSKKRQLRNKTSTGSKDWCSHLVPNSKVLIQSPCKL